MKLRFLSWVIPFYRNLPMLELHLENWASFEKQVLEHLTIFLVDDCSPLDERPDDLLRLAPAELRKRIRLLRVIDDIPWNQHGARNLGAKLSKTVWILLTDIDRIVPAHDMRILLSRSLDVRKYYKPLQYIARAKMPLSELNERAPYNQFLCTRKAYWRAGGYDEDYCGSYGGDSPFLNALKRQANFQRMTDVRMLRYNRHVLDGANTADLDRVAAKAEYARRFASKNKSGKTASVRPVRFRWTEIKL